MREDLRARALERMERSPLSLALFGAKALVSIVYYEHPDPARSIGYEAPPAEDAVPMVRAPMSNGQ